VVLGAIAGEVELHDVTFGYEPAAPVLSHVNLHISAGETIAFVGPTGAGKSTISKLLCRFYDPQCGAVRVDGVDLRQVELASLRRQVGVVPQEPYLFVGTIAHNIAFGRPSASEAEVRRAAELAGLGPLIKRLPRGLDTIVQERGQSLAAGERQLLALARAFLIDPRVLVLDEATSNLDLRSEQRIEDALDLLLKDRTAIVVAHRLSTAVRADRIAVIADGTIAEVGTHSELLEAGGRYAAMHAIWQLHAV
jgi:ATP-binding cassette subfamily B protein